MNQTYLAIDEDGCENIFYGKIPTRDYQDNMNQWILGNIHDTYVTLPKGSILKLIGKELTWKDEPHLFE